MSEASLLTRSFSSSIAPFNLLNNSVIVRMNPRDKKIHSQFAPEGHIRSNSRYSRNTPYSLLGYEERSVCDQERSGAAVEGGTEAIYDVSKTSIRRSLTPIVAFHAVRVSLPKLYCRKTDFTRASSPSVHNLPPPLLQGEGGRELQPAWSSSTRMSFAGSREPAGPARHLHLLLLFLLLLLLLFVFVFAPPRRLLARIYACRCSRYTVRVVNACIFLN